MTYRAINPPWQSAAYAVVEFLMPSRCGGCHAPGARLCDACSDEISSAPPIVHPAQSDLPALVALGAYGGRLRTVILELKFRRARTIGRVLGCKLARIVPWEVDFVVPVPLHPLRQRERGYNQAAEIAAGLATAARIPLLPDLLLRRRATSPQTSLDLVSRRANVRGAFGPGNHVSRIAGRRILLVDDVLTTGATAKACADVLRDQHAAAVYLASAAVRL